jgi:uncharacterized iron-regulated membrane protein
MNLKRSLILLCLAMLAMTGSLFAAEPQAEAKPDMEPPAAEAKKDKISMDEARAIALEKVPGGTVDSEELGRVAGKLTYFFDVRTEGQKGVDVVTVLASDGTVLEVKHKTEWAVRRDAQTKRRNAAKKDS